MFHLQMALCLFAASKCDFLTGVYLQGTNSHADGSLCP